MATATKRLEAELDDLIARFEAPAAVDEVAVIDVGERWQVIEPAELVRLRARIAVMRRGGQEVARC